MPTNFSDILYGNERCRPFSNKKIYYYELAILINNFRIHIECSRSEFEAIQE